MLTVFKYWCKAFHLRCLQEYWILFMSLLLLWTEIFPIIEDGNKHLVIRKKWHSQSILTTFMKGVSNMIIPFEILHAISELWKSLQIVQNTKTSRKIKHARRRLMKVNKANNLLFSHLFRIIFNQTSYSIK